MEKAAKVDRLRRLKEERLAWAKENLDPWITCDCLGSSGCDKCGWSEGHPA